MGRNWMPGSRVIKMDHEQAPQADQISTMSMFTPAAPCAVMVSHMFWTAQATAHISSHSGISLLATARRFMQMGIMYATLLKALLRLPSILARFLAKSSGLQSRSSTYNDRKLLTAYSDRSTQYRNVTLGTGWNGAAVSSNYGCLP